MRKFRNEAEWSYWRAGSLGITDFSKGKYI